MGNTVGQWHALIDCYGQHRRVEERAAAADFFARRDPLLVAAYVAAINIAQRTDGVRRVGFCLLSAGSSFFLLYLYLFFHPIL